MCFLKDIFEENDLLSIEKSKKLKIFNTSLINPKEQINMVLIPLLF